MYSSGNTIQTTVGLPLPDHILTQAILSTSIIVRKDCPGLNVLYFDEIHGGWSNVKIRQRPYITRRNYGGEKKIQLIRIFVSGYRRSATDRQTGDVTTRWKFRNCAIPTHNYILIKYYLIANYLTTRHTVCNYSWFNYDITVWGLSDVLSVPTHGNVFTVRTRLPIPTHLDFASPIHCSRLFTHLRWSFSSKFDIIKTTAKNLLAYRPMHRRNVVNRPCGTAAHSAYILHCDMSPKRPFLCHSQGRPLQHNAHCILSPGFDVGAMCRPSVCWRHRQVSLPDYLCHLKLCFTVSYVLFSSSALHCFFYPKPKLLFIVCCTAFSIRICLFTRGAILLGIESATLPEDEGEQSWRWRFTAAFYLFAVCLWTVQLKKLLSDFNDMWIVHCGPESSWLNFRKVSSIVILVLSENMPIHIPFST